MPGEAAFWVSNVGDSSRLSGNAVGIDDRNDATTIYSRHPVVQYLESLRAGVVLIIELCDIVVSVGVIVLLDTVLLLIGRW